MLFDKNEVKALMQVYAELCFSKIQFEHQISLTSNLVLHVDGANEYTYTLNEVILSNDKEAWCPSKQDSSMQTEPSDTSGNSKQNTVKAVLSGHSKIDKTQVLKTNGSLMKVENTLFEHSAILLTCIKQ